MKKINSNVACAGMDVHYKFSNVTFRDASGRRMDGWVAATERTQTDGWQPLSERSE